MIPKRGRTDSKKTESDTKDQKALESQSTRVSEHDAELELAVAFLQI
jgi:hypothetical protein